MIDLKQKDHNKDYYLWKSFKEGSDHSFGELYDQFADGLYRYGLHFSRDKDFIKDCIHDLFLDLYRYRKKLSMTDSIRFYLLRSLRRKINQKQIKPIDLIYDNNISPSIDNQEPAFEDSIIAAETEEENNLLLMNAIEKLTDRQREALALKFEHNLTYPEIAGILNITVESARTSIYRSLKMLRESIQEDKSFVQNYVSEI